MYTLLVVDDESIIRRGIHYHVDWKSYDIEVVGEAKNGEDGYQQALKYHPDIIVTDIKMPKMNGIQMAEKIRSVFPETAIIFLTGYEEKEYLLSAIRVGIDDYIMKSADSQHILQAVLRQKERLLKKEEEESQKSVKLLNECMGTIKGSFITSIFQGGASAELIRKQAEIFEFPIMGPRYVPILIPSVILSEPDNEILALLFHLSCFYPCICFQKQYGIIGFLNIDSETECFEKLRGIIRELKENYPEILMIAGESVDDILKLHERFDLMLRLSQGICWCEKEDLILAEKVSFQEIPKDLLYLLESEIIRAYRDKNTSEFIGKMEQFYSFSRSMALPIEQFRDSVQRLILSCDNAKDSFSDAYKVLNRIDSCQEPENIFQIVSDFLIQDMPKIVHSTIVENAKKYIEKNYAHNIGLKEIADDCHVSSSYISKVFKDDIQIGIVQYIHSVRIDKAKELLKTTNMRVTDIALEVGYSEYKRFSLYFLKYVGISPRDYRKKYENQKTS